MKSRRIFPKWYPCPQCGCEKHRHTGTRHAGEIQRRTCTGCGCEFVVVPAIVEERGPDGRSRFYKTA